MWIKLTVSIIVIIIFLFFLATYICYRMTFFAKNKPLKTDKIILPDQSSVNKYKEQIRQDIIDVRNMPYQSFEHKSFDGLILRGKFYEYKKDAPIEIMFHGYRSNGERDMSTGVKRAFLCGHSALVVDQRAAGNSSGHTISFGINERLDAVEWTKVISNHFGKNVPIILTGISMGGATVTLASCLDLPSNVIGALADCPFHSAQDIIQKVISDMKLPAKVCYPFVRLGAKIYGKFDLEATSASKAVKNAKIPIIFFHGKEDTYIPYQMSENLYNTCITKKKIILIDNADHGLCYLVDPVKYLEEARKFFKEIEDEFYNKEN